MQFDILTVVTSLALDPSTRDPEFLFERSQKAAGIVMSSSDPGIWRVTFVIVSQRVVM